MMIRKISLPSSSAAALSLLLLFSSGSFRVANATTTGGGLFRQVVQQPPPSLSSSSSSSKLMTAIEAAVTDRINANADFAAVGCQQHANSSSSNNNNNSKDISDVIKKQHLQRQQGQSDQGFSFQTATEDETLSKMNQVLRDDYYEEGSEEFSTSSSSSSNHRNLNQLDGEYEAWFAVLIQQVDILDSCRSVPTSMTFYISCGSSGKIYDTNDGMGKGLTNCFPNNDNTELTCTESQLKTYKVAADGEGDAYAAFVCRGSSMDAFKPTIRVQQESANCIDPPVFVSISGRNVQVFAICQNVIPESSEQYLVIQQPFNSGSTLICQGQPLGSSNIEGTCSVTTTCNGATAPPCTTNEIWHEITFEIQQGISTFAYRGDPSTCLIRVDDDDSSTSFWSSPGTATYEVMTGAASTLELCSFVSPNNDPSATVEISCGGELVGIYTTDGSPVPLDACSSSVSSSSGNGVTCPFSMFLGDGITSVFLVQCRGTTPDDLAIEIWINPPDMTCQPHSLDIDGSEVLSTYIYQVCPNNKVPGLGFYSNNLFAHTCTPIVATFNDVLTMKLVEDDPETGWIDESEEFQIPLQFCSWSEHDCKASRTCPIDSNGFYIDQQSLASLGDKIEGRHVDLTCLDIDVPAGASGSFGGEIPLDNGGGSSNNPSVPLPGGKNGGSGILAGTSGGFAIPLAFHSVALWGSCLLLLLFNC